MTTTVQTHPLISIRSDATVKDVAALMAVCTEALRVRDVMTAPAVACTDEAFFEEVAEILADRDISGMPVVDSAGRVIGVISERDLPG